MMTVLDSVSPHIGWEALAVVTDLVQPVTGTTFPQSGWEMAETEVNLTDADI